MIFLVLGVTGLEWHRNLLFISSGAIGEGIKSIPTPYQAKKSPSRAPTGSNLGT